jgi:hypothetical protein
MNDISEEAEEGSGTSMDVRYDESPLFHGNSYNIRALACKPCLW